MSENRDKVVAYEIWAKDGTLLRQANLALLGSALDTFDLPSRLQAHLRGEGELDWSRVECVSYAILEPVNPGKGYRRYSGWFDQSELEETGEVMTTVATAPTENPLADTSPKEMIETVEEILREEREDSGQA